MLTFTVGIRHRLLPTGLVRVNEILYQGFDEELAIRIAKYDGPQKRLWDCVKVKQVGGSTLYWWRAVEAQAAAPAPPQPREDPGKKYAVPAGMRSLSIADLAAKGPFWAAIARDLEPPEPEPLGNRPRPIRPVR